MEQKNCNSEKSFMNHAREIEQKNQEIEKLTIDYKKKRQIVRNQESLI